jgi:acid phosphatase
MFTFLGRFSTLADVRKYRRPSLFLSLALIAAGGATFGAAGAAHAEPQNLTRLKEEIATYIDSGAYDREIAQVATSAQAWLKQRATQRKPGERLIVIFDLDETLISNLPGMRPLDFGYVPAAWDAWVNAGRAPAIAPVLEVYRTARRLGLEVILLSGREERFRAGTEKNLRAIGCDDYAALVLKPNDARETTGAYKLAARRRLAAEGGTIVANIGDQKSDFEGGESERNFKLPDPFYLTK